MPEITIKDREQEDKPFRRRSVMVSPQWKFSPPGSRWGGFSISYAQLREIAKKSPTVSAIVNLRTNQVAAFTRPPRHKGDRGFEIVREDDPASTKEHDVRVCQEVQNFFLHTGWKRDDERKDSFADFLMKIIRDKYLIAAPAVEVVYDENGRPSEIWAVDGATIEIQLAERYIPTTRYGKELDQRVAYVQVVEGQIETEYAADQLIFRPSNPLTDIASGGYGLSELESCIDWVAAEVLALQYNSNYFDHGSVPPGILAIIGNFSEESLQELNVMWQTDVRGTVGQHKPLAIAMEDGQSINWIPMKQNNRDMEMGDFLDKLRTSICSVFGVDPVELGQRTAASSGGISTSDNTVAKIDLSKDKGLMPLLQWIETTINDYIMPRLAPGYVFRWTGIEAEDETKKVNYLNEQLGKGALTSREWRIAMGLSPVPPHFDKENEKILDMLLNPQAIQVWQAMQQEKQMKEQMEQQQQMQMQAQQQGAAGGQPGMPGQEGQQGQPAPQGGEVPQEQGQQPEAGPEQEGQQTQQSGGAGQEQQEPEEDTTSQFHRRNWDIDDLPVESDSKEAPARRHDSINTKRKRKPSHNTKPVFFH